MYELSLLNIIMCLMGFVFFFKQKTAYEMRISDWSSDVCSSDLTYGDKVILALFPGHSPRIPVSLKDVGLDREGKQIGDIPPVNVPDDSTPALGRSEERRVGQVCVRTCRSRWSTCH